MAVGIGLATKCGAFEPALAPEERIRRTPLVSVLDHTGLANRALAAIALISANRDEFRTLLRASDDEPTQVSFDHSAFETRPFLRCPDGSLWLLSPSALNAWMTRGFHHRILNAAGAGLSLADQEQTRRLRGRWLRFAGPLGERSVKRMLGGSFSASHLAHERLHPEITFDGAHGEQRSPDAAIESQPDLALIEVFSGRMSLAAKATDDNEPLLSYLSRAMTKKLAEVLDRADDVLAGRLSYPDWEGVPDRIYPVLVLTGDAPPVTPLLWRFINGGLAERMANSPHIARPLIADLDDLEPLLALAEGGRSLFELIRRFQGSPQQFFELRHWFVEEPDLQPDGHPRYVEEQLAAAHQAAVRVLFPTAPSRPGPPASRI